MGVIEEMGVGGIGRSTGLAGQTLVVNTDAVANIVATVISTAVSSATQ